MSNRVMTDSTQPRHKYKKAFCYGLFLLLSCASFSESDAANSKHKRHVSLKHHVNLLRTVGFYKSRHVDTSKLAKRQQEESQEAIDCSPRHALANEAQTRLAILFFAKTELEDRSVVRLRSWRLLHGKKNVSKVKAPTKVIDPCNNPNTAGTRSKRNEVAKFVAYNHRSLDSVLASLPKEKQWLVDMITETAEKHSVDPRLALSIVNVESNFQHTARSNANAMGLMQLIPETAERFDVQNAYDANQNVKGGVRYLRWLLNRYHGNIELVAAAYNAGEGAVDKYKGIPPYPETQEYVRRVRHLYPQS